ncbi:TPA: hypothetical protein ACF0PM_002231 [Clostridium perfringens]
MGKVSFSKKLVEQYELRNGWEWAFITIDSDRGIFQAHTSFGEFGYSWPNHGRETFKHFLIELDYDYLLNKISSETEVNGNKTKENWIKAILQDRKQKDLTAEEARELYDAVQDINFSQSINSVWDQFCYSKLGDIYSSEDFEVEVDYPISARMFFKKIMEPFKKIIREEINLKEVGHKL